jgi:hypothetical protein
MKIMSKIQLANDPVQVNVDEVQPRGRPPVTEQSRLGVFDRQRLTQQGIFQQVDLTDGEVVGCAPPQVNGIHP